MLYSDTDDRNIQKNLWEVGTGSQSPLQWLNPTSWQRDILCSCSAEHAGFAIEQDSYV